MGMESLYEIETFKIKLAVEEPKLAPARCALDAAAILRPIYADLDADQEHFSIFLLNNKNRVRAHKVISSGSLTASLVHPREVFKPVILYGAAGVILCHNHPRGDPDPSPEDTKLTERLMAAGVLMGISVLDHVILGDARYFSYREKGSI